LIDRHLDEARVSIDDLVVKALVDARADSMELQYMEYLEQIERVDRLILTPRAAATPVCARSIASGSPRANTANGACKRSRKPNLK